MHIIIGIILAILAIYLAAMAVWAIVYAIFVVPLYIVFWLYDTLRSIIMNLFIALDKLFYPGFDAFPVAIWAFWGAAMGMAVQGWQEMNVYGRKRLGALIAISPLLLILLIKFVQ